MRNPWGKLILGGGVVAAAIYGINKAGGLAGIKRDLLGTAPTVLPDPGNGGLTGNYLSDGCPAGVDYALGACCSNGIFWHLRADGKYYGVPVCRPGAICPQNIRVSDISPCTGAVVAY